VPGSAAALAGSPSDPASAAGQAANVEKLLGGAAQGIAAVDAKGNAVPGGIAKGAILSATSAVAPGAASISTFSKNLGSQVLQGLAGFAKSKLAALRSHVPSFVEVSATSTSDTPPSLVSVASSAASSGSSSGGLPGPDNGFKVVLVFGSGQTAAQIQAALNDAAGVYIYQKTGSSQTLLYPSDHDVAAMQSAGKLPKPGQSAPKPPTSAGSSTGPTKTPPVPPKPVGAGPPPTKVRRIHLELDQLDEADQDVYDFDNEIDHDADRLTLDRVVGRKRQRRPVNPLPKTLSVFNDVNAGVQKVDVFAEGENDE